MLQRWICLLLVCTLPGCVALAVGGAAAGGYYAGKDDRSAGEITDDVTITAAVKTKLLKDSEVKGLRINVDTYRKEVTLNGSVENSRQAVRAVALARDTKGVTKVVSKLEVRRRPSVESSEGA